MRIYYSRSNHVRDELNLPHIEAFLAALPGGREAQDLCMHERGSHYDVDQMEALIKSCDLFIIGSNVGDSNSYKNVAKGSYTEADIANQASIPLLVFQHDEQDNNKEVFVSSLLMEEDLLIDNPEYWGETHACLCLYDLHDQITSQHPDGRQAAFMSDSAEMRQMITTLFPNLPDHQMRSEPCEEPIEVDMTTGEVLNHQEPNRMLLLLM